MSNLIHDNPWLINQLLQSVADQDAKLAKRAQTVADPAAQQTADALRSLLTNLGDQLSPAARNSIDHTGVAQLSSTHMESMGDFVQWLLSNNTKIGGTQIVYAGNVAQPGEDYGYYKIEPGTEIVVPVARPDRSVVAYWINAEALKRYLISLQADIKLKNNPMFQVQLLKLVQDANKQLDVGMSETHQEELPITTEVDVVPPTLDMASWGQPGTKPLSLNDLKSAQSLNAWLGTNGITVKDKQGKPVVIGDQAWYDENLGNTAIQVLAKRALAMQSRATPETKKTVDAYVAAILSIAKSVGSDLTHLNQPNASNNSSQSSGSASGGNASTITPEAIAEIMPFNSNQIDFEAIKLFIDKYAEWLQANANQPQVAEHAQKIFAMRDTVLNSMRMAEDVLSGAGAPILIGNISLPQFKLLSRAPNDDRLLASYLYTIISQAGSIYADFVRMYSQGGRDAHEVNQQIAPGGPQSRNISSISNILSQIQDEINAKRH